MDTTADKSIRVAHGKDGFLAMLCHEPRNPLAAIHNGIDLLSHKTDDIPAPKKNKRE